MKYKVLITDIAKEDIKEKKKYILRNFKYREYAEYFSRKIKKAVQELDTLPDGYGTTGFRYRGYDIYLKAYKNYLLFYTVDKSAATVTVLRILQDGMDWENIIRQWIDRAQFFFQLFVCVLYFKDPAYFRRTI